MEVGAHPFPEQHDVPHDRVRLVPEVPDLVGATGEHRHAFRGDRLAMPMQAHDRTEHAILEPAHEQFPKRGGFWISPMEPTDIAVPPGNTAQPHIQSGTHLSLQRLTAAGDIPRPDSSSIALATGPAGAAQIDDLRLPFRVLVLIEAALVQQGIHVGDRLAIAQSKAQVVHLRDG